MVCKVCGNDLLSIFQLKSKLCDDCKKDKKTNSLVDETEKNQNSNEKNFPNEGNKIMKQKTDYPVMQALSLIHI